MSTLQQDYPPASLGYETLVGPATFTPYCFAGDCPTSPFPYGNYASWYTHRQEEDYKIGLARYLGSRQIQFDNNPWVTSPVFNSSMGPLATNFMKYNTRPAW